jgi:iron complex outermembrane receptor protein
MDRVRVLSILTTTAIAGLIGLGPCWAQDSDDPDAVEPAEVASEVADDQQQVFRGTVVVRDSPIVEGSDLDGLASLVTTVSDQQVEDLYARDLTQALRRVPGVVISRYNPVGAFGGGDGGAFFIRGHGSSRPGGEITMLTDGIPRFVGIWTHPLIDVANIDSMHSIDIYRSAQPVLLGNMAFAAVDMASKRRIQSGSGGRFSGSYGTYDTFVGSFEYGGRSDAFDYYLTAGHRQSDGHRDNAVGETTALSGRIGLRLAAGWELSMLYEHTASSAEDPGRIGLPAPPIVPTYDIANDFLLTTLRHGRGQWAGTVKLYYDAGTFDWLQWDPSQAESFRSITDSANYGFRWREAVNPWTGGDVVFGFDHDLYGGTFVERRPAGDRLATDITFRNTAPYVMLSHSFGRSVIVTPSAGVRYNDSRYFGSEWGGQAGVKVGISKHSLYANWAHAFNLPGVYAAVQYGGWGLGDSWQELEAETIDHLEVGWLAPLGGRWRLDVSVFRDDVENAIRFVPPPPPPPSFANVGAYTVDGLELAVQGELGEGLSLFAGGTYSDADPSTVPNLPETTAVGGLTWTAEPGWRVSVDLQWVDERFILNPRFASGEVKVDGYLLTNVKATVPWRLFRLDVDGGVFLVGDNLTDEVYEHRVGYPMPGRMIHLGIDLVF